MAAAAIAITTTRTATVTLLHLAIILAQLPPSSSSSQSRGHIEFCPVSFKKSGGCGVGKTTGDRECYVEGVSKHFHPLLKLRDCHCFPDGVNRSRCSCKAICRSD